MAQVKRQARPFCHEPKRAKSLEASPTSPNDGSQGGCGCVHGDLPRIADCGFDPIDVLIIDFVRCVCAGYASGETRHWDCACDLAERELGLVDGPSFVARTISLMRAIQCERKGGFGYMAWGCSHVSEHELLVIALIRAARQQNTDEFTSALSNLASVPNPVRIAIAASALAGLCIRHESLCSMCGSMGSRVVN